MHFPVLVSYKLDTVDVNITSQRAYVQHTTYVRRENLKHLSLLDAFSPWAFWRTVLFFNDLFGSLWGEKERGGTPFSSVCLPVSNIFTIRVIQRVIQREILFSYRRRSTKRIARVLCRRASTLPPDSRLLFPLF